jgi:hypothetical protein
MKTARMSTDQPMDAMTGCWSGQEEPVAPTAGPPKR